jgi:uncharacterized iron-regulated membrane protein
MEAQPKKHRPKTWFLIKMREWHTWLGVILSGVIIAICITGIYLNHEHFFDDLFVAPKAKKQQMLASNENMRPDSLEALYTTTPLDAFPVSFGQALASAKGLLGEVQLKQIELKDESGAITYKIKVQHEEGDEPTEVYINAITGEAKLKEPYKKMGDSYDWGKILKDIHTGKIGGEAGRLLIDFTSIVIIFLTATGIYLWYIPRLRKKQAAAAKTRANP